MGQLDPRLTHLQRAFQVFERLNPQVLTARQLAALMCTWPSAAYKYVERLKRAKCIEAKGGNGKIPSYGLAAGATMPAGDCRGRKKKSAGAARIDEDDDAPIGAGA